MKEQADLEERLRNATDGRRSRRMVSYCEDQPFFNDDDEEWEIEETAESEDEGIIIRETRNMKRKRGERERGEGKGRERG